ncbi:MAG: polyamine aminopropyltransferase [Halobacteriovoraceae bacterium]|jgi:spermidine synthase|nr:polyamine aminopropyltransferase [Halobacteriovoraceae bacterium]MBT5096084.1 polyamine aminopropyltransferase [Halobacteriovoraceae bacterium]
MYSQLWVEEQYKEFLGLRYKVDKVLFSGKSEFQTVDVVETVGHGRMLLNDGYVMVTERDEFIYHDMIAHVPLFVHPNPLKVLIIGGGDGGTAREVLRHSKVESVTMVEIDKMVTDACIEFIPKTAACLSDPRVTLKFEDGVSFVKKTAEKYDVILVDSTDPIGPATPLFNEDFYRDVHAILADDGIVVSQGESTFYEAEMQTKLMQIKNGLFDISMLYQFTNSTYPGGLWAFTYASKGLHPIRDFKADRVVESGLDFEYYNAKMHSSAFSLPTFVEKRLAHLIKE